jgi:hypothetical protein
VVISGNLQGMYRAGKTINRIGVVTIGNESFIHAGTKVILHPGFKANTGNKAKISIRECCINQ